MDVKTLNKALGNIDLYLLDQLLKGRYAKQNKILDAGCGEGRNMIYFLNNQFDIYGIDKNEPALQMLRFLARSINPSFQSTKIALGFLDRLPYEDRYFDHVICSAVLHFAESENHFEAMAGELARVLKPEGTIFIRMASNIGLESKVVALPGQQHRIPDGSVRFLLTRKLLKNLMDSHGFVLIEPLKTVNVQDQRCMSTLLLKKV